METVAQRPADVELHLLTEWGDPFSRTRTRRAGVFSVLVHAGLIGILILVPASIPEGPREEAQIRRVTPLVEPLPELTQKAPTKGKINREFDMRSLAPRPKIQIPEGPPSTTRPRAPAPFIPPVQAARPTAPSVPEPPKVEQPKVDVPQIAQAPQIQPVEKPRSPFETPAAVPSAPTGRVPIPGPSVSDAIRQGVRGSPGAGLTVGDLGESGPGGYGEAANLPPSPGNSGSQLQLLSDPQGVDFRPYLIRVLASVRQHWLAVIPQSVAMGRRGKVSIQFAIARDGRVPKLVIANPSGAEPLDRAAVAGISASVPFPQLPAEFRGDRIVLQFNFAYNMPK